MRRFPDDISFIPPWRRYQRRVLENLDRHLENRHLHLVALPGSGKTVLGLEVMLRVNKPTIILAPTLTIKEQWLQRFLELFLKTNEKPEWISTHIKQPAFVTITADQALHSLFEKETEEAEVFKMEAGKPCRAPWKRASSAKKKEPIGFGRSSWMKRIHFPIFPLNHFITNGFSESPAAFSTLG